MSKEVIKANEPRELEVIGLEAAPDSDLLLRIAKQAEERIEAIKRIKLAALKLTNESDWVDQNGRPYLQASGAEKIARSFGISWRIDEPIYEEDSDGHFMYTYKGEFTMAGITVEAIGTRSSKDDFFRVRYREGNRITLPPSEIDKGNVKKSAYTNCIGNGIKRLLGIRNLTWEELEKEAGIKRTRVSDIPYRDRKKSGAPKQTITEAQLKRLEELVKQFGKTLDDLIPWIAEKYDTMDITSLTKAQASDLIKRLEAGIKDAGSGEEEAQNNQEK